MAQQAGDIVFDIKGDDAHLSKTLGSVERQFAGTAQAIGATMAAVGAAITGVVVGFGASALKASGDINRSALKIAASLGQSAEEAERFGEIIKRVYGDNFGESLSDVGAAVQEVANTMRRVGVVSEDAIVKATENAFALRDAFGVGIGESVNAATGLMQNFGLNVEEAFDFITLGMQRGLNASGDFLDSIGEYSTQFAEGGATAADFFNLLEGGMQSGMLGTDKAADAFKEFRVRLLDGSKSTNAAMNALGLSLRKINREISNGTTTHIEVWNMVVDKLMQVKNAGAQLQIGVALLGTQFEDLGMKTVQSMFAFDETKIEGMTGATEKLAVQYQTLGNDIEGFRRKTELAGVSLVDAIAPGLNSIMNSISPLIDRFTTWAEENENLASSLVWVAAAVGGLLVIGGTLIALLPGISAAFVGVSSMSWPMIGAIVAIGSALAGLAYYTYESMAAWDGWQGVFDWARGLFDSAVAWVDANTGQIGQILSNAGEAILLMMGILWESLVMGFSLVWSILSAVFSEFGEGFVSLSNTTGSESETILGTIERLSNLAVDYLGFFSKQIQLFSDFMSSIWPLISAVVWVGTNLVLEPLFFLVDSMLWVFEQISWIGTGIADALAWLFGAGGGYAGGVNINGPTGLATGGVVLGGGWAMVGERGPELVNLPRGATVYDHEQTAAAGGGATVQITNHFNGMTDGNEISRIMARQVSTELRALGF